MFSKDRKEENKNKKNQRKGSPNSIGSEDRKKNGKNTTITMMISPRSITQKTQ